MPEVIRICITMNVGNNNNKIMPVNNQHSNNNKKLIMIVEKGKKVESLSISAC